MTTDSHTLVRWIADRADVAPDTIAVIDGGIAVTYRTLNERADGLAARLRTAGYGIGDRVATVAGNSVDQIVLLFACAQVGMVYVPLSWRLTVRELADLIFRSAPELVLVDDEHEAAAAEALRAAGGRAQLLHLGSGGVEVAVPERRDGVAHQRAVRDDDALMVIFTSGSESRPKGVVLSHANCFWTNLALGSVVQLRSDDVVLNVLPQFHVAAWNCQPLLALRAGATLVLERGFQPARALQLIAEHRVTAMMGVPTQYRMLADDVRFADTDVSGLRYALVGGATMPADLSDLYRAHGIDLIQGYGLTEASPNVACALPGVSGVIGRPYAHVEVRLSDPETGGELVGAATGELWVRGPSVFAGYLDDAEATERALAEGWLRSGDIAARAADGTLRIVDRLKNIFISGGENVAPAEVEAALEQHAHVLRAAVVGVPDEVWGERGVAFVVVSAPMSQDELLTHARQNLAAFKLPVHIEFVSELPTSALEKIARATLTGRARQLMGVTP